MKVQPNFQALTKGLEFFTLTFVGTPMAEGNFDLSAMAKDGSNGAKAAEKAANLSTVLNTVGLKAQAVISSLDSTGLIVKVAVESKKAWKDDNDLKAAFDKVKLYQGNGDGQKIAASVTVAKADVL